MLQALQKWPGICRTAVVLLSRKGDLPEMHRPPASRGPGEGTGGPAPLARAQANTEPTDASRSFARIRKEG